MDPEIAHAVVGAVAVGITVGWLSRGCWRTDAELPTLEEPLRPVAPRLTDALDRPVHLPPRRARRLATHRRSRA